MRPIIGILGAVDDGGAVSLLHKYSESIELSGGLPVLLPYIRTNDAVQSFVECCDGFLFSGGVDIYPRRYGETMQPACGDVQQKRDDLEFRVFNKIFESGKPILAVCRGAQLVNVALGGTLYQDIPSELGGELPHRQTEGLYDFSHYVNVVEDSPFFAIARNGRVRVNSFHHQAIKELGKGLGVMARADDGVIEAVCFEGERYLRAYQWHPERLYYSDWVSKRIFDDFVNNCKKL